MLILQIAHLDTPDVRITALNVIYDLLMWHGLPSFITNSPNDKPNADNGDDSNSSVAKTSEYCVNDHEERYVIWQESCSTKAYSSEQCPSDA